MSLCSLASRPPIVENTRVFCPVTDVEVAAELLLYCINELDVFSQICPCILMLGPPQSQNIGLDSGWGGGVVKPPNVYSMKLNERSNLTFQKSLLSRFLPLMMLLQLEEKKNL